MARLDVLLVHRGLFPSRERAKEEIIAGHVTVNGKLERRPGRETPESAKIALTAEPLRYVGRGGLKLEKALKTFGISPAGKVCLDCGASTGGFTDCLLQFAAEKVFALDVGSSQLSERLRNDSRVVSMENFNARDLRPEHLSDAPALITVDVSFISLRLVLPALAGVLTEDGNIICLIKPQFEAGRARLGKGGVIRDRAVHAQVLGELTEFFPSLGLSLQGLTWSPIRGGEGNLEFLCCLGRGGTSFRPEIPKIVEEAHRELR